MIFQREVSKARYVKIVNNIEEKLPTSSRIAKASDIELEEYSG